MKGKQRVCNHRTSRGEVVSESERNDSGHTSGTVMRSNSGLSLPILSKG